MTRPSIPVSLLNGRLFSLVRSAAVALSILACCLVALPATTLAQSSAPGSAAPAKIAPQLIEKIDSAVRQALASTGVPSASIAIVQQGRIAYLQAYGNARLSPPADAEPGMRYPVGSISKQFTAAAMLLMAQDGKLQLDDPVSKYLPELTRAREVTLRMLLSHTSGYQDYWPEDYVMTSMMQPVSADHILDVWGKKPLDFDPGTKWQYSNTNYVIAGKIVEQVSGMKLIDVLRSRVFAPLGMKDVSDVDSNPLAAGEPIGYYRHALGPLRPAPGEGSGWMFAAGELAMPARDLAIWDISLIEQSLLKAASYREMFEPVLLKNGATTGYGLGVFIGIRDGHPYLEHSGEVSGFVSENLVYPADRAAIVVLTNQDASQAAGMIGRALAPLVLDAGTAAGSIGSKSSATLQAEAQALAIFVGLQKGQLDRSRFTDLCNAYFTPEAIEDYRASLAPLGSPTSFTQTREELRGGMTFRSFSVKFPHRDLTVTTYATPEGKLEQYLVIP